MLDVSVYAYRYYSPYLGQWTARDPIEEAGGPNLYLFVVNSPPNGYDRFGLDTVSAANISWIAAFRANDNPLNMSEVDHAVWGFGGNTIAMNGLSWTANPDPPLYVFGASDVDWRETRGGFIIQFTAECVGSNKQTPSLSAEIRYQNPGYTPSPLPQNSRWDWTYSRAEGREVSIERVSHRDLGEPHTESLIADQRGRIGGFKAMGGRFMTDHGIPWIGRRIAVTLDCCTHSYRISFGGSEFPSHAGYIQGGQVASHRQTHPEILMFGTENADLPIQYFFRSDWIDLGSHP